jgi:DNA repair exonuclease SbcCD ATPase subunit
MLSVGCSTPASLPPSVAVGLDGLRNEAVALRGQIEKTVGALKEMMSKPQSDLSPQYQSFTHELGILEAKVEAARQQRAATDTVVKDQFMAWDDNLKQLQNEESRQRAAERRAATEATYSGIQQKIAELKKDWTPFVIDLKDTRQYLKSDLSKEGLHTIEPTADRVFDQQGNVLKRLDDVISAMDSAIKSR